MEALTPNKALLVLVREALKTHALGFRKEDSREDTGEHEKAENLEAVLFLFVSRPDQHWAQNS
jgi:hypothetical protein